MFEVFLPQLLLYPNPSDPLNGEAAALMMRDRTAYDQRVKGSNAAFVNRVYIGCLLYGFPDILELPFSFFFSLFTYTALAVGAIEF